MIHYIDCISALCSSTVKIKSPCKLALANLHRDSIRILMKVTRAQYLFLNKAFAIYIHIRKLADSSREWHEGALLIATTPKSKGRRYSFHWIGPLTLDRTFKCGVFSKKAASTIFKSLIWLDLGLKPALPAYWWALYVYIYIVFHPWSTHTHIYFLNLNCLKVLLRYIFIRIKLTTNSF